MIGQISQGNTATARSSNAVVGALLGIHAQTSLHAGAGTALGVVDLPIQRERHTHWPNIAGSALKGILRDAYRENVAAKHSKKRKEADSEQELIDLFGPPKASPQDFAGALSITDARLLAFPVRSFKGVFAWVSCRTALDRLRRDAKLAQFDLSLLPSTPEIATECFLAPPGCECILTSGRLVLEEFDFAPAPAPAPKDSEELGQLAAWIADNLLPTNPAFAETRRRFATHFVLLSDDYFTHFVRHATEISARIALDYDSKTVRKGALFYQEFLPAESLLYSLSLMNRSRSVSATGNANGNGNGNGHSSKHARDLHIQWSDCVNQSPFLQIGGDETTGKGLCAVRLTKGVQTPGIQEVAT